MRNPTEVGFPEGTFNLFAEQKRNVASKIYNKFNGKNYQVWISEANSGVSKRSAKNVSTVIRNK